MNETETRELKKMTERLRWKIAQANVTDKTAANTYSWGLSDGMNMAYEMIKEFQDKYAITRGPIGENL